VVLHPLQQFAVSDAGGGEEAVVTLDQIIGRQHGIQFVAGGDGGGPLVVVAGIQATLNLAAHALERRRGQHALWRSANAEQDVGARPGPAGGDGAGHVAVGDQADAGAGGPHLGNQPIMTGSVEDHRCQIADGAPHGVGEGIEVLGGGAADVAGSLAPGADRQLFHVDAWSGIEHRPAFGHGDDRQRPAPAEGGQGRAVDRVDGYVGLRRGPVADEFPVEQHRSVVLLAFTDDDDSVHGHRRKDGPHRFDGSTVGSQLVTATHPPAGRHGGSFGCTHQIHGQVAVGRLPGGGHSPDHSWSPVQACPFGPRGAAILGSVQHIVVQPNGPLSGTVQAGGAKNSSLKLMVACLLTEGRTVLSNVPHIDDVETMAEVLRAVGAQVERLEGGDLAVTTPAPEHLNPVAPYELVERMRASVVVLGLLLARCGSVRMPLPGGDDFGDRPIDFHVNGLTAMGARFESSHGEVCGHVDGGRLIGTTVVLEYPSHTATDNLLMAAVLAKGTTVIENAAKEPEVSDLAAMLCAMGATVRGAGTSHIEIEGVDELHPARYTVVPDRVVAATYLAAAGMTGGEVTVSDARPDHMEMLLRKMTQMGVVTDMGPNGLRAIGPARLTAADVATLPYPGVATDYSPLLVAMLTVAEGVGILTENLFSGRFRYVEELRRMGADIRTEGHHAVVRGVSRLSGAPVRAPDIRAGVALVLAGLVADGETVVSGAHHIGRGYEDLVGALVSLGAKVTSA